MLIDFSKLISLYSKEGASTVFEKICAELFREEYGNVRPIRANPGDEGIDMLGILCLDGNVYQCKFFVRDLEKSQKDQIRRSYNKAKNYMGDQLVNWFLIIPKNLDVKENEWFMEWSQKTSQKDGVCIDLIGEAKLSSLLAKYSWIKDKYFQSNEGQISVLKEVVKNQAEIITTLRSGFEPSMRKPDLKLMACSPDREISETIPLQVFEESITNYVPPSIDLDEEFIRFHYTSFVGEEKVNKVINDYKNDWATWCKRSIAYEKKKSQKDSYNYIVFVVSNEGTMPATNVRTYIELPDGVEWLSEVNFQDRYKAQKPSMPKRPEETLEELMLSSLPFAATAAAARFLGTPNYNNGAIDILAAHSQIMTGHAIEETRSDMYIEKSTAKFWLKKVSHNDWDCPESSIYMRCTNQDAVLNYRIKADEVPNVVEGQLRVEISNESWTYWSF